jgi:hypothetical protein
MSNSGIWKFNVLVTVAAVLMLVSWLLPWWTANIEALGNDVVQIHPWGLEVDPRLGGFTIFLKGAAVPAWLAPSVWGYFALCMVALLLSLCIRERKIGFGRLKMQLSRLLVGGVGISYIVAAVIAIVYASIRLKAFFDTPLQGRKPVDLGEAMRTYVNTSLLLGYYLTYCAGFLLIALAILYQKVIGGLKPDAQEGERDRAKAIS